MPAIKTPGCAMRWPGLLTSLTLLLTLLLHSLAQAAPLPTVQALQNVLHTKAQVIRVVEPHLSTPHKPVQVQYRGWPAKQVPPEVQQSPWEERAQQELALLFKALGSGDTTTIAAHLAPEFQIVRSNGAVYDKAAYLERSIPVIHTTPHFRNLRVTGQNDIRVVSFNLEVNEQINGKTVENLAPQLIVFRDIGTRWVVVASANLGRLQ